MWWKRGWDGDSNARAERVEYAEAAKHFDEVDRAVRREHGGTGLSNAEFTRRLAATMQRDLTDRERKLILDEETRAWQLGRELLAASGWTDDATYEERARVGVYNYRVRMGIEPVTD